MNIQPKPYLDKFKHRHQSIGNERRRNMSKMILDHGTPLPKPVELKDIDACVKEWVENELDISFDGKRLPTFKLFSNQRLNEYAQTWNHLDEVGNLLMNFKTLSRENNPKKGENQGSYYNIPGNRDYPMFIVPVLQENGLEAYDMYSMKQPFSVDLEYKVTVVTNKYELINEMNQLVHDKFKAIDCYIFPNEHPMPMTLEDVSDESEYALDDRKYYSQTYVIKLKAYIIKEEDFKVTKLESRVKVGILGERTKKKNQHKISIEEQLYDENPCKSELYSRYFYKSLTLRINLGCNDDVDFEIDTDMIFETVEVENVLKLRVTVNGEFIELEDLTKVYKGDKIHMQVVMEDEFYSGSIVFGGYDPNTILDSENMNKEFEEDAVTDEEIVIN